MIGLFAYLASHFIARALRWPEGHAIGWAAFAAVAIGAGIDLWHLFSLFFVNPGSPARVQLALAGIHDPSGLGTRAVMEIFGALGGVLQFARTFLELGKRFPRGNIVSLGLIGLDRKSTRLNSSH